MNPQQSGVQLGLIGEDRLSFSGENMTLCFRDSLISIISLPVLAQSARSLINPAFGHCTKGAS